MWVFEKWSGKFKKKKKNRIFILIVRLGTVYLADNENVFAESIIDKAKS